MKEKKYTLPDEAEEPVLASEPTVSSTRLADLHRRLVNRVMTIQNPETLQSLIMYVDENILHLSDPFEKEWNHSVSIEEFRKQCKDKLKEMYE